MGVQSLSMLRALVIIYTGLLTACGSSPGPIEPGGGNFITSGDARLAYSLDLPHGAGPFPAIVAGHGSGRVTRQQMEGFAARWTAMGFAVLRFDKRGVGESTGVYRRGRPQHPGPHDRHEPGGPRRGGKAVRVEDVSGPRAWTLVRRVVRRRRLGPAFSLSQLRPARLPKFELRRRRHVALQHRLNLLERVIVVCRRVRHDAVGGREYLQVSHVGVICGAPPVCQETCECHRRESLAFHSSSSSSWIASHWERLAWHIDDPLEHFHATTSAIMLHRRRSWSCWELPVCRGQRVTEGHRESDSVFL